MPIPEFCSNLSQAIKEVVDVVSTEGGSAHRRCPECQADVIGRRLPKSKDFPKRFLINLSIDGLENCKKYPNQQG